MIDAYTKSPVLMFAGIARVAYTVIRAYTLIEGGPEPIRAWDELTGQEQDELQTKTSRVLANPFSQAEELNLSDDPKVAKLFYETVRALS